MRVIQLLPTISYGDAVGNDTLALAEILRDMGFQTNIYAENIDPRLPSGTATHVSQIPELSGDDVILYHGSTGTEINEALPQMLGRKVMIYHNITPPKFFSAYSSGAEQLTKYGLEGISQLADKLDYCIAVSQFNRSDLLHMGFNCPIDVCPILIPFEDYEKKPDGQTMKELDDGKVNLLFVGRIAPNKKQEDVIRAFYAYHRYYEPNSRLILAGSWGGMEKYYNRLCDYVELLGLRDDVVFTGHIKFNKLLAYYRRAHAFLCMSEHEGFCVPLVEAMYFDVPIVAYASTAIPDTLGGSGVLLRDKKPQTAAREIDRIIKNREQRERVLEKQRERLKDFQYEVVSRKLRELLSNFISITPQKSGRVLQMTSTISRGDAVGNDIFAFQDAIVKMGVPSPIYVENFRGENGNMLHELSTLPRLCKDDIAIYHHATGTGIAKRFASLPCKKVLVYHNVTPPQFFAPYDENAAKACQWGLDNLLEMREHVDLCFADSQFNKNDLKALGYTCPIEVCPILIPFEDYARQPDQNVLNRYADGRTNLVFVGRVAPNKKFEDIISAFAAYKALDPSARLILVGSYSQEDAYYQFLKHHVEKIQVNDVLFTGHIRFEEILAYYRVASVFLCMSEHEGFCVPLIEAMYFDVPIVAYASTAVPETLGGSGVLLDTKEPQKVAQAIQRLTQDKAYRKSIIGGQRQRLKAFSYENVNQTLQRLLQSMMEA